jgi:hypothetical protein
MPFIDMPRQQAVDVDNYKQKFKQFFFLCAFIIPQTMTSSTNQLLEPFSSDAKDAFAVYLTENSSKYRITATEKEDIIF